MMRLLGLLGFVVLLYGCMPEFKSSPKDRLFLKEIKNGTIKLEWFFYSTISSQSPDYITIQQGHEIDTICSANNIADLNIEGNKIVVGFFGTPEKYTKPIKVPSGMMNYEIVVDTNFVLSSPTPRKYYKREE